MDKLFIGVSGINAVDNPGPGIGVARSLREDSGLDVSIVGLAYDAMEPGIFMDWVVDKSFIMPYPSGGGEAFIQRLLYIKESHGLDFVIPNLDVELPLYIQCARTLEDAGIRTFLPDMEQFKLRGKDRLIEIAKKIGIALPRTKVVNSLDELSRAVTEIGLPVMVKGSFYKAHRAYTTQEATAHYHALVAEWGYPVIVQQVVTGDELNVVGLGDGDGRSLGSVGIKKMSITALGKIWTGVTVKNERMLDAAERFVREFKWRGPFELECIVSGDQVWLVEVNPRFPAWSYFATGVGVNLPARLVRHSLGLPVPPARDYEAGKLFVRYTDELVTDMATFQKAVTRGEAP
ncbi:MAG: ATP-grasp domain-containing protein [Verrucomicrobia bacterium]|nr:ATP-grasp domain-containing protein [Verrucomicrobiota bacterium]